MDATAQEQPKAERKSLSLMNLGVTTWGRSNNSEGNPEDGEENENQYHSYDDWGELEAVRQQSASTSFSASSASYIARRLTRTEQFSASIAACFLKNYEAGQPPTLSSNFSDITRRQLAIYRIKHSLLWRIFGLMPATIFLFVPDYNERWLTFSLHTCSILLFATDLYMMDELYLGRSRLEMGYTNRLLFHLMTIFLLLIGQQNVLELFFPDNIIVRTLSLSVAVLKPIVFFYQSRRARDALVALIRISKKLLRVILIEMFLILVFASVACRLYYNHESFQTLPQSWFSLFALSTTVVNPSIWMPAYYESPWNAVFFVIFIIVSIFYMHSLVLSVVFQVFIQSAKEVHCQSTSDKENSLKLAFGALAWSGNKSNKTENESGTNRSDSVDICLICETLRLLRPHYNQQKLNVLIDIIAPPNADSEVSTSPKGSKRYVKFDGFRKRMHQALSSSVRATRTHSTSGMAVEGLSVSVSVLNFLYVMTFASRLNPGDYGDTKEFVVGFIITLLSLFESSLRYKIWKHSNRINPITRLNTILDGMGCLGGVVSIGGIILTLSGNQTGVEYLLMGRSIGMIQSMRFSIWFREVLQRSFYVLPFLAGPIILILMTMHIFVIIGMTLWKGSVVAEDQAENEDIEYLYYLNNFNSYREGCITVFNVLVVNDWTEIANVFLYASTCSSPVIVYIYFVLLVIIAVCILLNVIVAFFVETFVSQMNLVEVENELPHQGSALDTSFLSVSMSMSQVSPTFAPFAQSWIFDANDLKKTKVIASRSKRTEFDVIRREGFDDIMESVGDQFEEIARGLLDTLEFVSTLSRRDEAIGHIVCCRQTKLHLKSKNFSTVAVDYLPREEDVQQIVLSIEEKFLNRNARDLRSNACNRAGMYIPSPKQDTSKVLNVEGFILPQNQSILLLTFVVDELGTEISFSW